MAAVTLASNAPILSDRATMNSFVGQRVAALRKALSHAAKLLISQIADADLKALGFNDEMRPVR